LALHSTMQHGYHNCTVIAAIKTKRFSLIYLSPRERAAAPQSACAVQCLPTNDCSCADVSGRPPRHLQAKESAAFQDFIIEAKALSVPIQKLEPISLRPAKGGRPHRRRLLRGRTSWVSAARPAMPLRMSVTPQTTCTRTQCPRTKSLRFHQARITASAPKSRAMFAVEVGSCGRCASAVRPPSGPRRWVCQRWRNAVFRNYSKEGKKRHPAFRRTKVLVLQIMPQRIDLLPRDLRGACATLRDRRTIPVSTEHGQFQASLRRSRRRPTFKPRSHHSISRPPPKTPSG